MDNIFAIMAGSKGEIKVNEVFVVTMTGPQTWKYPRALWKLYNFNRGLTPDLYRPLYGFRVKTLKNK